MIILNGKPNLWVTADWHLGHRYFITTKKRPFSSVEEMNEAYIANHNAVVRKGDLVYVLGDLYLQMKLEQCMEIQKRLNGNFYVIEGNHDGLAVQMMKKHNSFVWIRQLEEIKIGQPWFDDKSKKMVTLCHYAMRSWRNAPYGTWMLYGHSHGMLPELPTHLSFDIGVDIPEWNFSPVSMEQIKAKMDRKLPAFLEWKESRKGQHLEFEILEDEEGR